MKGAMLNPSVCSRPWTALSSSNLSDSTSVPYTTIFSGKTRPPSSSRHLRQTREICPFLEYVTGCCLSCLFRLTWPVRLSPSASVEWAHTSPHSPAWWRSTASLWTAFSASPARPPHGWARTLDALRECCWNRPAALILAVASSFPQSCRLSRDHGWQQGERAERSPLTHPGHKGGHCGLWSPVLRQVFAQSSAISAGRWVWRGPR